MKKGEKVVDTKTLEAQGAHDTVRSKEERIMARRIA